jgi:hypothetical protein
MTRFSMYVFVVAAMLLGCGDKASTPDAPRSPGGLIDASVAVIDSAPMFDAAKPDAGTTPMPSPSWTAVHNEFKALCTPCHGANGGSGGHKMGQPYALKAHMDSQLTAGRCAGVKKGECAAVRIRAGEMPPGGLPTADRTRVAALIDAWVAAGQPQ